jgi:hypothetical protein
MTDYSDPMNTYPPPFPEFVKDEQPQCPGEQPLAGIIEQADWYAKVDANAGLAFHLARHWETIRAALTHSRPNRTSLLTTPQESDR